MDDFNKAMETMKSLHRAASKYIEDTKPEGWARALFPVKRFGHVTSNMAECMNKWFGESRYLDPVAFFRAYTVKLNCMFEKRRLLYSKLEDDDVPKKVAAMIEKAMVEGDVLKITQHTGDIFEVQRKTVATAMPVVDLSKMTCTCGFFIEHGVPCYHMCKAATSIGVHPNTLVIPERRVGVLKRTYQGFFVPVDVNDLKDDGTNPPTKTKK